MTIARTMDCAEPVAVEDAVPAGKAPFENRVTAWIADHRKMLFVLIACLYVLGFNGKWRLGLDSANYRGLALNLAQGKGYTFGDWAPRQIYPGLPYIFAGIEKVLGPADRAVGPDETRRLLEASPATAASVLFVLATGIATLLIVYRLIRLHYPAWIATTITCGVATNSIFLQHCHELLTDVPFLLGVVMSLYGWDLLKLASDRRARVRAMTFVVPGLALAATMRPTFWVLALAWGLVCVWGLIAGPRRRFYALSLAVLLAIWIGFVAIAPWSHGLNPLSGGYEREAISLIPHAADHLGGQIHYILHDQLPAAVFGEQLAPFSIEGSLLVLGSCLLLLRRHALWVLMVYGTFAVTTLLSAEPRYYLMVLPILLLGWLMMLCALGRRVPARWGEVILVVGLAIVVLNNLSASVHFFVEQHRPHFMQHYKNGSYVPVLDMAELVREHTAPDQKVLGPSGSIMSIFSGRHVYTQRELLPRGDSSSAPAKVAAAGLDFVVCPGSLYRDKEPVIARMLLRRIILPIKVIASLPKEQYRRTIPQGMYLAAVKITIPQGDWRKLPHDWRPPAEIKPVKKKHPATRPVKRKKHVATTRRSRVRPTRPAPARRATKPATTKPSVAPATQPQTSISQPLRAITTMLSPVRLDASGAELSGVDVYGGSIRILEAACWTCGCGSPLRIVSFLSPKYAPTVGASRPRFFSEPMSLSRPSGRAGEFPYEKLRSTVMPWPASS